MKFYLSSYRIGNQAERLQEFVPPGKKLGYIPNASDGISEIEERQKSIVRDVNDIIGLGIDVEILDLKDYFNKKDNLKEKLASLAGVWVKGGNTFVLRQAMKLSGFDEIIQNMDRADFLYSGYSAGVCVLASDLKSLQQVDDPTLMPYQTLREVLWEGLGILDYMVLPHYKSDHPESEAIDKEVEYCKKNGVAFKTLRDGEVIVID